MRVPYAVTVHSFRHKDVFDDPHMCDRLRKAYEGAHRIIAISEDVKNDLYERIGLDRARVSIVSSALPVSQWEYNMSTTGYVPPEWLQAKVRILANAGRIVKYKGKDLYGLDVLAQSMRMIPDADVHCLMVIGEIVDADVLHQLHQIVGDDTHIHVLRHYEGALTPVVAHAHIVVRPTRTEGGESLTLSEALELGRWAVGSDAVARPNNTVMFTNESETDLHRALMQCIERVRNNEFPAPYKPSDDRAALIVNLVTGS